MDIVGQVVDRGPQRGARGDEWDEVDVADRAVAVAVYEINEAADPLYDRDVELHRPDLCVHRLGAQRDRPLIGLGGIGDAERACRG
jgi:hypothetical protein